MSISYAFYVISYWLVNYIMICELRSTAKCQTASYELWLVLTLLAQFVFTCHGVAKFTISISFQIFRFSYWSPHTLIIFVGRLLEAKRPHLYWSPCAAHCLDLMLEDIGKIPSIKKTLKNAIFLNGFLYSKVGIVNMMRESLLDKESC